MTWSATLSALAVALTYFSQLSFPKWSVYNLLYLIIIVNFILICKNGKIITHVVSVGMEEWIKWNKDTKMFFLIFKTGIIRQKKSLIRMHISYSSTLYNLSLSCVVGMILHASSPWHSSLYNSLTMSVERLLIWWDITLMIRLNVKKRFCHSNLGY